MSKSLKIYSIVIIIAGVMMIGGGLWGVMFVFQNVTREKITTPDDASIPGVLVHGPLTLKAQTDIIREHTLKMTSDKTFAEMPRQIPKLDASGSAVLGADGKPAMVANTARDIWITATTLTTALNLAIISYAFFGLVFLLGVILVLIGISFRALTRSRT